MKWCQWLRHHDSNETNTGCIWDWCHTKQLLHMQISAMELTFQYIPMYWHGYIVHGNVFTLDIQKCVSLCRLSACLSSFKVIVFGSLHFQKPLFMETKPDHCVILPSHFQLLQNTKHPTAGVHRIISEDACGEKKKNPSNISKAK